MVEDRNRPAGDPVYSQIGSLPTHQLPESVRDLLLVGKLDKSIPAPQLAGELRAALTGRLTALILFHDPKIKEQVINARDLDSVVDGSREISPEMEGRIRTTHQIVQMLSSYEETQTIRAWFIGMNPVLENRSPALTIASNPEEVINAAKAFLAE